jgi:hypothetical protein|tara:strand:+ start:286 stop:543 length:258 start_codon:yes stop_codon:yes gene_type:complete
MTIYRRLTFVVADMNATEDNELMPAVLTTMGVVETPFIGGTGIMLIDTDEVPLTLAEIEVPVPLAAQADVVEFPATFSSVEDEPS